MSSGVLGEDASPPEGIDRGVLVFKVKPRFSIDAVVVAFTTRATEPDQVRALLLGLVRPDGAVQLVGSVGNFPGAEARQALLQQLLGTERKSAFRQASSGGALYRFVQPRLVVEVAGTAVQAGDGDGGSVQRWALRHDEAQGWSGVAPVASASLLHPVFVRVRTDKGVDDVDARVAQLDERCPLPDVAHAVSPTTLPPSVIVRRQAWTKTTRGRTAVRKVLVGRAATTAKKKATTKKTTT